MRLVEDFPAQIVAFSYSAHISPGWAIRKFVLCFPTFSHCINLVFPLKHTFPKIVISLCAKKQTLLTQKYCASVRQFSAHGRHCICVVSCVVNFFFNWPLLLEVQGVQEDKHKVLQLGQCNQDCWSTVTKRNQALISNRQGKVIECSCSIRNEIWSHSSSQVISFGLISSNQSCGYR